MSSCLFFDFKQQAVEKKSLKDAILCIGWFKTMSVTLYITMFFFTKFYSYGMMMVPLMLLMLGGLIPTVFLGVMMFWGSLQESYYVVCTGLVACYILGTYDLIVGLLGAGYHVLVADDVQHYILTLAYVFLALTSLPTFSHDAYLIKSYRQILASELNNQFEQCCNKN